SGLELPDPPNGYTYAQSPEGGALMEDYDAGDGRIVQRPVLVPLQGTTAEETALDVQKQQTAAINNAEQMLSTIDSVMNDPALGFATGLTSLTSRIPGTGAYRAGTKIAQLKGQIFMQAYENLKGGGVITEIEGEKAEAALARLDPGMKDEDFIEALNELKAVVEAGLKRAQSIASPRASELSDDQLMQLYGN
ncbi:MAG: hypothetical protein GY945_06105, partial [Rhodobacteraceae bacterium]|nr:hypothetical protein [Paracoccaceae bacterium]